ncbi:Ku protein [Metallumcola ferriviriculae]|uniref:Non-homologous end joining protein Ku n=1 Tax=Metallumcola ferriviriculae TaxID=3039180 RepID=A0AAU0ULE3_9FIRM|nr:Ku protein [Desulfitibacteraceae bacterium MK1]
MRSMWKGAVSFGLVNIPVKMYTATEIKNIKFNLLHKECKTPIQYHKVCPVCEKELSQDEIVKGFEYEKGKYVILEDEDFENLPLNTLKSIDILDFVNLNEIDPVYFMKSYFLAPGDYGEKAYQLLYTALEKTDKIAVAKVFLRSKESLAALRIYQEAIMLHTMFFPKEIRSVESLTELQQNIEVHENEIKMAVNLVNNLSASFNPEKYTSDYREAMMELIRSKIDKEEIATPARPQAPQVVDLMQALKQSVKAAKEENKKQVKTKQKKRA